MVLFGVRCVEPDNIKKFMLDLHNRSEPTSNFIISEGSDLSRIADGSNYPKIIKYGEQRYSQRLELYVGNKLILEST